MSTLSDMAIPTYTLNDGSSFPAIGFGTYPLQDGEAVSAIVSAVEVGYRTTMEALDKARAAPLGARLFIA